MPSLTAHRRRVLVLRHRQRDWDAALEDLFDKDGRSLFYDLCLARDGYGTRAEAFARFEARCTELLAVMTEARPTEGPEVEARWRIWFDDYPRPAGWSPRGRDVGLLRFRDNVWRDAIDTLFAGAASDADCAELLEMMREARPEEAARVEDELARRRSLAVE
jgi:hypothetical protein